MGVYLTLREYGPDLDGLGTHEGEAIRLFGRQLIGNVGRENMIHHLCGLVMAISRPEMAAQLRLGLEASITPTSRARLVAALDVEPRHHLLALQPVLMALSQAIVDDGDFLWAGIEATPPEVAALMLTHAVGASLNWPETEADEPRIGGHPERIAVDFVCNQTLYGDDDLVGVLDRTLRLWRDYGSVGAPKLGGRQPAELLESITGLEIEDFLALGFTLYLQRLQWTPGAPWRLADTFGSDMDEAKKAAFLAFVARTPEQMTDRLRRSPPRSDWDFMAHIESPVLHYPGTNEPGGLVVIDLAFLLQKITFGLYWLVHDHLRDHEGDLARQRWTQAWGDMVEAMIEDSLRPHAPPVLGAQSTFYTEDDLKAVYPGHKTSDVVIDAGDTIMAIEIGSGRPSAETTRGGSPDALRKDLERLAFKKIRQLDDTSRCLIRAPQDLLGYEGPARPLQPVVVAAGGFVMSPVTANAVKEYCESHDLLTFTRTPAMITVDEVEMLEGLAESRGISMARVLEDWKASSLRDMTLRNYLLDRFGRDDILAYRPTRMRPRFDALAEDIISRLKLRPPETKTPAA
jgi:hypothetical protein